MNVKNLTIFLMSFFALLPTVTMRSDNAPVEKKIYLFAVAFNYQDSITYITDIQPMDNVMMNPKTKSVANFEMYTDQLGTFLKIQGKYGYICSAFYAEKYKDIEKTYLKVKKRFNKEKFTRLQNLTSNDFQFKFVNSKNIYQNELKDEEEEDQ